LKAYFLFLLLLPLFFVSGAHDPNVTLYLHALKHTVSCPSGSVTTVLNTTKLFSSGSTATGSANFCLSLSGPITISGSAVLTLFLYASSSQQATVSGTLSLGATNVPFSCTFTASPSIPSSSCSISISTTQVSAGSYITLSLSLPTGVTLYYDSANYPSSLTLPLSSPPVSVGKPTFVTYASSGASVAVNFEVNDSFGYYDLDSVTLLVIQPGGYTYTVSATPSSSATPFQYTTQFTAIVANVAGGVYTVSGQALDNSENSYSGASAQLTVVPSYTAVSIWGVLVAMASVFTLTAFFSSATAGKTPIRIITYFMRAVVLCFVSSVLWFVLGLFSSTLGVFISSGISYLFIGLGFVMFLLGLAVSIILVTPRREVF